MRSLMQVAGMRGLSRQVLDLLLVQSLHASGGTWNSKALRGSSSGWTMSTADARFTRYVSTVPPNDHAWIREAILNNALAQRTGGHRH